MLGNIQTARQLRKAAPQYWSFELDDATLRDLCIELEALPPEGEEEPNAEDSMEQLADLIDPTCRPVRDGKRYICSACGYLVGSATSGMKDRHCAKCGSRVLWSGEI